MNEADSCQGMSEWAHRFISSSGIVVISGKMLQVLTLSQCNLHRIKGQQWY